MKHVRLILGVMVIVIAAGCGRGGSSSSGGSGGSSGGGGGGSSDPLSALDDTFTGASLDAKWTQVINTGTDGTFSLSGGQLFIDPVGDPTNTWFNADSGIHLYQTVDATNDFKITLTNVATYLRTAHPTTTHLAGSYQIGGVLIQSANDAGDWLHIGVGTGAVGGQQVIEDKNTIDASSALTTQPTGAGGFGWTTENIADLRICKVGNDYRLYYREGGTSGAWTLNATRTRADMANINVRAGMFCYSWDNPHTADGDLVRCAFTDFSVETVSNGAADCTL